MTRSCILVIHTPGETTWVRLNGARNLVIEAQTGERCSCVSENKHEGQNQRKQNTSQKSHMKIQMIAATGKTI